jgi:hypothetical protein
LRRRWHRFSCASARGGYRKDEDTLDQMLPPEAFTGMGMRNDAGVY